MTLGSFRIRGTALAALFAIALQAFWPLLALAKPARPAILVPVCTLGGVAHYVELPAGDSPLERRSSTHHEHCQFCVSERAAIPKLAALPGILAAAPSERVSIPAPAPVRESLCPTPAQPRAPPAAA